MVEQYEPFGPEWEKEMMKHNKASLISMIRTIGAEKLSAEDAWAIYRPGTGIYYFTVTDTKACAIRSITEGWKMLWKECKGYGVRLVQIRMVLVEYAKNNHGRVPCEEEEKTRGSAGGNGSTPGRKRTSGRSG